MTTEDKQTFLYKEIIDAGLDAEEFQLYLENKNPEAGLDITRWDFNELKEIVRQFKARDKEANSPTRANVPPKSTKPKGQPPVPSVDDKSKQQTASPPKIGFGQKIPIKPKAPVEEKKLPQKPASTSVSVKQPEPAIKPSVPTEKKSQVAKPVPAEKKVIAPITESQVREPARVEVQPGSQDQYSNVDALTKEEIFSRSLNCERMELSLLFNLDVTVEVKKYEIVQGGMFSQDYAVYTIDTPKQNWSVARRYNDFVWLRETLERLHPGMPVPPIAKKSSYRKFTDVHLKRRMLVLQSFLNKLLTIPELKGQLILCDFLRLSDQLEYLKFKKASTIEEDRRLQKLKTLKGKVTLMIDPKINKFIGLSRQHLTESEPLLRKVYKESKAVSKLLDGSAELLNSISSTFRDLSEISNSYNKASELNIKSSSSYLFDIMQGITRNLAKTFTDQSQLIYKYLYCTYKYESLNTLSTLDSLGKLETAKGQYRDCKAKLRRTKQKLLEDRNYSKWGMSTAQTERLMSSKDTQFDKKELMGMMLPKETEQEVQLKQYYSLLNFQIYEEISRYNHHNPKFLSVQLLDLSRKQSRLISQGMMMWADFMTNVMSFQEGKRMCEMEIAPVKR